MNQFENSLVAMKNLLDAVGETHWAGWIATDLQDWREDRDSSHHLAAYGGMGSFNDMWITRGNRHTVTRAQEPWANSLFVWLKAICFHLAKHPTEFLTAEALSRLVGRSVPSLSAFVGGENAPPSMRGYATPVFKFKGWRCLRCGFSETSSGDIEDMVAENLLPGLVFRSCETLTLDRLVDEVLALTIEEANELREKLTTAIKQNGIALNDREDWMRPCPNCGQDDTAVYRWVVSGDGQNSVEPSADNLPMR